MSFKSSASPNWKSNRVAALVKRIPRGSVTSAGSFGRESREQQSVSTTHNNFATEISVMPELNLDETLRVRDIFSEFVNDEYITTMFTLRVVLSQLGMYPCDEELSFLLGVFENKISINNLCHYLRFYKRKFQISARQRRGENPEGSAQEECEDTLRAFVSLGGAEDGTGSVQLEDLRKVCRDFGLTIDIDAMLVDVVDIEYQKTLNYTEFCDMWRSRRHRPEHGSTTSVQESQIDILSALRALGMDGSSALLLSSKSPECSAIVAKDEVGVDGYKFPLNADPGSSFQQQQSNNMAVLRSEAQHLQALKRFLVPEVAGVSILHNTLPLARRKAPRHQSTLPALHVAAVAENDQRRSYFYSREDGTNAATGFGGKDDGGLPALTGGTAGGYRAPSPMILSLRNSTAYKKRLQAFVQKSRMRAKGRVSSVRTRFTSISPEDDGRS
ncbi:hypothetical protein MOQ_002138 [Trypanosoma cruzi marinkellei]|uniref:EF-hand domain-containing protein n=1 Tax=Trypanosoma cruzi marinkellei TaxID=85056 RepID=K2NIW0_TRYCR|nr:hypothetical protein MOQ_002138 [Trypanosoma cruzi marinkellei]